MKPHFHKVPVLMQNSFSIRHDVQPNFGTIWHYHPELELHYIIRGEGIRFIGTNISNFSSDEMILIGQNLPHTWRCSEEYFQDNPYKEVEAMVLHFRQDCLGESLLSLPEAYLLPRLFERAKNGLMIQGRTKEKLAELMYDSLEATNLDRIILLLSILKLLAEAEDVETIALPHEAAPQSNEFDTGRLDKIYTYTLSHFKKEITLEEIAAIANLSVTSFCRYFKLMTNKTYYNFLTEIRVSHACRLLVDDHLPTEIICYDCGFNNVSNFYRHFKKVIGLTPLEYKRKYIGASLVEAIA